MNENHRATVTGIIALLFWASSALILVLIGPLPVFEIQALLFSMSFLLAYWLFGASLFQAFKRIPVKLLCIGVLGIYGTNTFFVAAFQYAPPEKVDLINYLWPIMVILLSSVVNKDKLKVQHMLGAFLSFYGIFYLLSDEFGVNGFALSHWPGYILAFLNALCWSIFTVYLRKYSQVPSQFIGLCCGISALISVFNHCFFETFVMPNFTQMALLILLAMTSQGLAHYYWQTGIRSGNYHLLCVLSYFNPIISVGLLILFGFAPISTRLTLACLLVTLGSAVVIFSKQFILNPNTD